jgi:CRP/FNR family cyclic AMP-dependent transcriptional regulator
MSKRERDALAHVPLFEGLSPRHLKHLADLAREDRLMTGATIVKAGDPGDTFYVILEGEAKVVNASNRVVNRLQPGDSFGEISLLDGGPRTATVIAETPMRVATLERKAFLRTLEAEPAVAVKLLSDAAKLLRRLTRSAAG